MDNQAIKKISIAFRIPEDDLKKCLKERPKPKITQREVLFKDNPQANSEKQNLKAIYFFEEDFHELEKKINRIKKEIQRLGAEIAHSVDVSGETFHDNFVYEEGGRQQSMWTQEILKLESIRSRAKVIKFLPDGEKIVKLGKIVKLSLNGKVSSIRIGSFLNFKKNSISYASEFSQKIMGLKIGDQKNILINEKKTVVIIKEIN